MRFTDSDLQAIAEIRIYNSRLRWGIKRGLWNFFYAMAPLIIYAGAAPFLIWEMKGYGFLIALVTGVVIMSYRAAQSSRLAKREYDTIKKDYAKDH